jgi:hypothetical protein
MEFQISKSPAYGQAGRLQKNPKDQCPDNPNLTPLPFFHEIVKSLKTVTPAPHQSAG